MTEKKRQKEEKEFLHRLRPFARLQTAEDYEAFTTDMLCKWTAIPYLHYLIDGCCAFFLDEALLRKRIQELQQYRRLGLSTSADIEKYDLDLAKRVCSPILLSIRPFYNLLASRHRRLHQQGILHQIDCNTGLVVVNRQDPMLDVQVLHLSLEIRKIESLVNQHQDLVRPLGQVPAHLYAAVVSTAWFSWPLFLTVSFQLLPWISLTAHPYTSSLMARKPYAHRCDFYPNHILSLKRLLFASMHEGEANYGGVRLETWLKLMLISSVEFGISLFNLDISR